MRRTLKAVVQYDGTDYLGFQVQKKGPTVQGALEQALQQVTQETVRITGAGRTDSGVHARAQVVSFNSGWTRSLEELQRAWNARLPETIAIQSLDVTADEFHARRSAKARTYRYTIDNRPVRAPLSDRYMWTVTAPLDDAVMHGALQTYVGVHDFEAFGRPPKTGESTEREVLSARCWRELDRVSVELSANAFLQGMVRRIVGALVAVGSGQITARDFEGLLRARDKRRVKWKAAPQGLCLWQVDYDDTAADSW